MAEALAKDILKKLQKESVTVFSAGTGAYPGQPASENAVRALLEIGIDLSTHQSSLLTKDLVDEADLILTMTSKHKQRVLEIAPEAATKVFLLKEFGNDAYEFESMKQRAVELYQIVQEKQDTFLEQHKEYLNQLEEERLELTNRLQHINEQLGILEAELKKSTNGELAALEEIQKKLNDLEIVDPFAQPLNVYRTCRDQLFEAIEKSLIKYNRGVE